MGQDVSYYKLWDAKQKAIDNIYRDWDKSYEELPNFLLKVQNKNPGTKWNTKTIIPTMQVLIFFTVFFRRLVLALQGSNIVGQLSASMEHIFMVDMKGSC